MLKKVFICIFVVLLLTTLVVPAFASSASGDNSATVHHSKVPIAYIQQLNGSVGSGTIADWPNNSFSSDGSGVYASVSGLSFDCQFSDGVFDTLLSPRDATYFRLFIPEYFWDSSQHFVINDGGANNYVFATVKISGQLAYFDNYNDQYGLRTTSFSKRVSVYTSELNIDLLVGEAISGISYRGDVAFLQDVVIEFNFYAKSSASSPDIHFLIREHTGTDQLTSWIYYQRLLRNQVVSGGSDVGMFDWLLDSVNAFLDFEIAPDLSLNGIFYIVLVVGILLWFITLLI